MNKKWTSYHGAEGECWYKNQYCKCSGQLEIGNPSIFRVGEIEFHHNQINEYRIQIFLYHTSIDFRDCVIIVKRNTSLMPYFNSLVTSGSFNFDLFNEEYIRVISVVEPSSPSSSPAEVEKKWWKIW